MTKEKLRLMLATTMIYANALNDMNDITSYNTQQRSIGHKSTLNRKQSSKRRNKNRLAKKSRKANRK